MLTCNMSGVSCVATRLTSWLANPGVRAEQRPELYRQSRRCCWPLCCPAREGYCAMRGRKAFDPGLGASAGLSEVAQWPRLDRPEPRLQAARYDNAVCGA